MVGMKEVEVISKIISSELEEESNLKEALTLIYYGSIGGVLAMIGLIILMIFACILGTINLIKLIFKKSKRSKRIKRIKRINGRRVKVKVIKRLYK